MTNAHRTIRNFILASAVAVSLGAIGNTAVAGVNVEIGVPIPGIVVNANDPYFYSPSYCAGCWYGEWGGRTGYHRGGGRPWERAHMESDHHGRSDGHDVRHEGHM